MSGGHHHHYHTAIGVLDPERYEASRRVTWVSVVANVVLAAAQIVIGIIGQSQALIADGMHTLSDLITDVMVLFALKHGAKAADEEHPYGHARIETATTMLLGGLLLLVGIGIAVGAGLRLVDPAPFVIPSAITLAVAIGTLLAKEGLYRYTLHTADRFDSNMLRANAWHHRSDAVSSLIVVAGIGGALLGFGYLDAVAAILVSIMVAKVGGQLAWQALRELIDTGLSQQELASVRRTIQSVGGVKALHMLRTRRVGGQALVDVHILVDPRISVSEGHHIGEAVRDKLLHAAVPIADVMVHVDTEEDVNQSRANELPPRAEVERRLAGYFAAIPEAKLIERLTLHYMVSGIEVEVVLPRSVLVDGSTPATLAEQFATATNGDPAIAGIEVLFR